MTCDGLLGEKDVIVEEHSPLLSPPPVFWDNIKEISNKCCTQTTFFFNYKQVWRKERKLHSIIRMSQSLSEEIMPFIRLTWKKQTMLQTLMPFFIF